jgi:hypothetical protein
MLARLRRFWPARAFFRQIAMPECILKSHHIMIVRCYTLLQVPCALEWRDRLDVCPSDSTLWSALSNLTISWLCDVTHYNRYPVHWNDVYDWTFGLHFHSMTLHYLSDHSDFFVALTNDWASYASKESLERFMPTVFRYEIDVTVRSATKCDAILRCNFP